MMKIKKINIYFIIILYNIKKINNQLNIWPNINGDWGLGIGD